MSSLQSIEAQSRSMAMAHYSTVQYNAALPSKGMEETTMRDESDDTQLRGMTTKARKASALHCRVTMERMMEMTMIMNSWSDGDAKE